MGCSSSTTKDVEVIGRTASDDVPKLAIGGSTTGGSSSTDDGALPSARGSAAAGLAAPVVETLQVTLRRGESGRLGLQLNDANRVVRTDWNSAATSAGVEPWDRVTHVNGKRLKPGALLQDVVGAKDAEVKLTLERLSEDELVERGAQTERNERLSI